MIPSLKLIANVRGDRNLNHSILASDGVDVVVQALQLVPEICVSALGRGFVTAGEAELGVYL